MIWGSWQSPSWAGGLLSSLFNQLHRLCRLGPAGSMLLSWGVGVAPCIWSSCFPASQPEQLLCNCFKQNDLKKGTAIKKVCEALN